MKFYRFGNEDKPVIMLLPGTCCHWKTFSAVIPLLKDTFQVVCISYDGFDENEPDAIFPTMTEETKKIESYIKAKFGGRIFALTAARWAEALWGCLSDVKKYISITAL